MLKFLKQARAALSLLNPEEVRKQAVRPVHVGLVASGHRGYDELEEFLSPEVPHRVHRSDSPRAPRSVDFVLYQHGIAAGEDAYTFQRNDPEATISQILDDNQEMWLALARQFPVFRKPVIDRIVNAAARENAMFAVATALPNVLPSFLELPWAVGEFASDTAFLTGNQIRMAFLIAAACGKPVGFSQQKAAVLTIVGSAFGWRALARELVGKVPLGGGLVPKGAIAFAGTMAVGKSLEYWYHTNGRTPVAERDETGQSVLASRD